MKLFSVIELLVLLANKIIDAWQLSRKREKDEDFNKDINDIQNDPVGYANRKYGGLPDATDKSLRGGAADRN